MSTFLIKQLRTTPSSSHIMTGVAVQFALFNFTPKDSALVVIKVAQTVNYQKTIRLTIRQLKGFLGRL